MKQRIIPICPDQSKIERDCYLDYWGQSNGIPSGPKKLTFSVCLSSVPVCSLYVGGYITLTQDSKRTVWCLYDYELEYTESGRVILHATCYEDPAVAAPDLLLCAAISYELYNKARSDYDALRQLTEIEDKCKFDGYYILSIGETILHGDEYYSPDEVWESIVHNNPNIGTKIEADWALCRRRRTTMDLEEPQNEQEELSEDELEKRRQYEFFFGKKK